jgi:hypothetical protein
MPNYGINLPNYQSVTFEDALDGTRPTKAAITFPDFKSATVGLGQPVIITRDGYPIWQGLGVNNEVTMDKNNKRQYVLNCYSNKIYLQREVFSKYFNFDSNGNALQNFVVSYGGAYQSLSNFLPSGIVQNTLATSIFQDILNTQYAPILTPGKLGSGAPHVCGLVATRMKALDLLTQLIAGSTWESRFNPDNSVDFLPQVGVTNPSFDIIEGLNIVENGFKNTTDISKSCNYAVVCGGGTASGSGTNLLDSQIVAIAKDQPSIDQFGRWSIIENMANVTDSLMLQTYANALVADLKIPPQTCTVDIMESQKGINYRIGDAVLVTSPSFNIYEQIYRITDVKRTFDANNKEQITLSLAQNIRQLSVKQFHLDDVATRLQNFHTSHKVLLNALNPSVVTPAQIYPGSNFYVCTPDPAVTIFNMLAAGEQTSHIYMSFSLSGYAPDSAVFTVIVSLQSGAGTVIDLFVNDLTNGGANLLAVPSPNLGQPYQSNPMGGTAYDPSDHVFDIMVTASTSSTFSYKLLPLLLYSAPRLAA